MVLGLKIAHQPHQSSVGVTVASETTKPAPTTRWTVITPPSDAPTTTTSAAPSTTTSKPAPVTTTSVAAPPPLLAPTVAMPPVVVTTAPPPPAPVTVAARPAALTLSTTEASGFCAGTRVIMDNPAGKIPVGDTMVELRSTSRYGGPILSFDGPVMVDGPVTKGVVITGARLQVDPYQEFDGLPLVTGTGPLANRHIGTTGDRTLDFVPVPTSGQIRAITLCHA